MSVRTCMHFMSHSSDQLPTIKLRQHPSLPTLTLSLVLNDQDFSWSDTAERMRELFTAILAEPLLALPLPESALLTKAAPLTQPAVPEKEVAEAAVCMGAGREDCCLSFPQHRKTPRSWACCQHHPAAPAPVETRLTEEGK